MARSEVRPGVGTWCGVQEAGPAVASALRPHGRCAVRVLEERIGACGIFYDALTSHANEAEVTKRRTFICGKGVIGGYL